MKILEIEKVGQHWWIMQMRGWQASRWSYQSQLMKLPSKLQNSLSGYLMKHTDRPFCLWMHEVINPSWCVWMGPKGERACQCASSMLWKEKNRKLLEWPCTDRWVLILFGCQVWNVFAAISIYNAWTSSAFHPILAIKYHRVNLRGMQTPDACKSCMQGDQSKIIAYRKNPRWRTCF